MRYQVVRTWDGGVLSTSSTREAAEQMAYNAARDLGMRAGEDPVNYGIEIREASDGSKVQM